MTLRELRDELNKLTEDQLDSRALVVTKKVSTEDCKYAEYTAIDSVSIDKILQQPVINARTR